MGQPRIERLLRLMMLLTSNRNYEIGDVATRLDITERSVYRYIETLRNAGFVIKKSSGFYRIDQSSPYFKDISSLVHFTEEEAWVLKNAIESIDENNLIKQNLKKKLYTVYDYRILAETVARGKHAQNINALVEAIEEGKQATLRGYSSANSKNITDRLVEPFAFTTNYIQIWAYDTASKTNKIFKVSRINKVEVMGTTWQSKEKHAKARIDIFGISSNKNLPVKIKMSLRAANLLIEEYPLAEKHLQHIDDDHWILNTEVCGYEGVGRFVNGLIDEIENIEPREFRQFLVEKIATGLKKLKIFLSLT